MGHKSNLSDCVRDERRETKDVRRKPRTIGSRGWFPETGDWGDFNIVITPDPRPQ
jgi:hypothetical protein